MESFKALAVNIVIQEINYIYGNLHAVLSLIIICFTIYMHCIIIIIIFIFMYYYDPIITLIVLTAVT